MYSLKLKNNYIKAITAGPSKVGVNETMEFPDISGDFFGVTIPEVGTVYIRDLGKDKVPGYDFLKGEYGVLIRVKTSEAYYRFDGKGGLELLVDSLGVCTLSVTNGTILEIQLPELIIK